MAVLAIKGTLGQSLGSGKYNSVAGTGSADPYAAAGTADTAVASSQALEAAVTSAVSAAAANVTISGNGTALALVQAIQTAFNLLITANVAAKAATVIAKAGVTGDMIVLIDNAVIDTKNKLVSALRSVRENANGSNKFTDA